MTTTALQLALVPPELLACALVTVAALALAWIGVRRSASADECARVLRQQLGVERDARAQADLALAASQDVVWRLVRPHASAASGLGHALERCLAEHAQLHGLRYRFTADMPPAARAGRHRTVGVAVLQFVHEVLAASVDAGAAGEVTMRLSEAAGVLGLEIDGCVLGRHGGLPADLLDRLQARGGVLRNFGARRDRWSLSLPLPLPELAQVA